MNEDTYLNEHILLDVGDGHTLNIYDWGNKQAAVPIIFLHGGPGSQVKEKHKAIFDPKVNRVIFFDQRGSGLSTPYGQLKDNTTQNLIQDITKIADRFGIKEFALHGNSWGSTLALAYAIENPDRVKALVIGGIFTGSKSEADWVDKGRFKSFYPDVWENYVNSVPAENKKDPSAYHFDKVISGTPEEQKASGYAYECLEAGVIRLDDRFTPGEFQDYDPSGIRIEMYYLANGCFMPDRYILENANKLVMPVHIVQGRYDMACPPKAAYELHSRLPNSNLYWTLGGHQVEHEGQNIFKAIIASL